MRPYRFISSLFLGLLVAVLLAAGVRPALAQCVETGHDVNCTGNDLDGFVNWTDGWTVTIQPGAYVWNQYNKAVEVRNNNVIVNNGAIETIGTHHADGSFTIGAHDGIFVANNNVITNNGSITANSTGGYGVEFWISNTFTNNGTITTYGDQSFGIAMSMGGNLINNYGTVTTYGPNGGGFYFDGHDTRGGPNLLNNYGSIEALGANGIGLWYEEQGGDVVNNSGLIAATGAGSMGVVGSPFEDTLNNTGTMTGDFDMGAGADVITNSGAGAINGNVAMGAGDDALTNSAVVNGAVGMGDGNDVLTNSGAGAINGNVTTGAGSDSLTNSATITGAVDMGDGNDVLTNSGAGTLNGDVAMGAGGDTLTNSAAIEGAVDMGAGNDILTNSGAGTINGNVTMGAGDDSLTNSATITGAVDMGTDDDTLANNGTLDGPVNMGSGNDTLALSEGAVVNGVMDGGVGVDALSFTFTVQAAEYPALAAVLHSATAPAGGTLTINGNVYTWVNFEALVDLLTVLGTLDDGSGTATTITITINAIRDGRLNGLDFAATAILFCGPTGLDLYAVTGNGVEFAYRVDTGTIQAGLVAAAAAGAPVEIAPEAARLGVHLYALDGTTLQANGPDGYTFVFHNNVCGIGG